MARRERIALSENELAQLMVALEPAFDVVRVVDPARNAARVLREDSDDLGLAEPYRCFTSLHRCHRCANCVSARTVASRRSESKLDFVGDDVYHVATRYVEVDGVPCSLEMIRRVTEEAALFAQNAAQAVRDIEARDTARYLDPVTGAYNENYLRDSLSALAGRHIAALRVTNASQIYGRYGLAVGDAAMRAVSRAARARIRRNDTLIRMDDATFVLQFDSIPSEVFERRIYELQALVGDVLVPEAEDLVLSACATGVDREGRIEDLVREALSLLADTSPERPVLIARDEREAPVTSVDALADAGKSQRLYQDDSDQLAASDLDALTGLPSPAVFRTRAQRAIETPGDAGRQLYFVHFDLENFKSFNRVHGYAEGDVLLCHLADAIRAAFPNGLLTRVSVDHFDLLTDSAELDQLLQRLHDDILGYSRRTPMELKCGVYVVDDPTMGSGVAADRAKIACDTIKGTYDVTVRYYDDQLGNEISSSRFVVDNLDRALAEGHVLAYYQPVVRALTGRVCGLEALSRWVDPHRGMLPPGQFIGTLERAHMIDKHDVYLLRRVCRDISQMRAQGLDIPVSINLSRLDFQLCDIFQVVEDAVAGAGIPKSSLHLEVTESALDENADFFRAQVERFRKAGYEVWMDDFGSGYSSLNLLKDYGFDVLKIDMAFLQGLQGNDRSPKIIASIVDMGKRLGLRTLAEGVETPEQRDFLRELGCEMLQGYLFSQPVGLGELFEMLAGGKLEPESPAERGFYQAVGKINLLAPINLDAARPVEDAMEAHDYGIPYAIVELRESQPQLLTANHPFDELVRELGYRQDELNDAMARVLASGALPSGLGDGTGTEVELPQAGAPNAQVFVLRRIASSEGVDAFLVSTRASVLPALASA